MPTVENGGSSRRKALVLGALIFGILGVATLAALHARTTELNKKIAPKNTPKETREALRRDGPPPPHPGDDDIVFDEKLYEWSPPTELPDAKKNPVPKK
ncbi:MAG: hypothetical protein IOD12_01180 [Silvanigrellales bacterium]|nr:hypothetical protein [Silvanigrellales bacterium]